MINSDFSKCFRIPSLKDTCELLFLNANLVNYPYRLYMFIYVSNGIPPFWMLFSHKQLIETWRALCRTIAFNIVLGSVGHNVLEILLSLTGIL